MDEINYDTVILGGNLESLVYSFVNGIPIVLAYPQIPFSLDVDDTGQNLERTWRKLSFYLSYATLNPFANMVSSVTVEEDHLIVVGITPWRIKVNFKKLIRFDDFKIPERRRVFDYISVLRTNNTELSKLEGKETKDLLVKRFRMNTNNDYTIVAVESYLTMAQIEKIEYSELYARLKATKLIEKFGVKGNPEFTPQGHPRIRKITTKTLKREVIYDLEKQERLAVLGHPETKDQKLQKLVERFGNPYVDGHTGRQKRQKPVQYSGNRADSWQETQF